MSNRTTSDGRAALAEKAANQQPLVRLSQNAAIRLYREAAHMSQGQLAEHVGVTQGTISKWETMTIPIPAENVKRLARALHCPQEYIREGLVPYSIVNPESVTETIARARGRGNAVGTYPEVDSPYKAVLSDLIALYESDGARFGAACLMVRALREQVERRGDG